MLLSAWSPFAGPVQVEWRPDAGGSLDRVEGQGTLVFLRPNSASYDPDAQLGRFTGNFVDGAPEGQGRLEAIGMLRYEGDWRNGLMHGRGMLWSADGSQYDGEFAAGLRHGAGIEIDAYGNVSRGTFVDGRIQHPAAMVLAATAGQDGLSVGLSVDPAVPLDDLAPLPVSYTTRATEMRLEIQPANARLLGAWKGKEPISLDDSEEDDFYRFDYTPSFLGAYERYLPVPMVLSLENASTDTVAVVGAYIDVASSVPDNEPAVQVRDRFSYRGCWGVGRPFEPAFDIDNFGWTHIEDAAVNVTLNPVRGDAPPLSLDVPLGRVGKTATVDLSDFLKSNGVDTERLAAVKHYEESTYLCPSRGDAEICRAQLTESGVFGKLDDYVDEYGFLSGTGRLDYDWLGNDKTRHSETAGFSASMQLADLFMWCSEGEGGEIIPVTHDALALKASGENYRVPVPFAAEIAPGFTTRWRINVRAPRTALHDFSIALVLSDGRTIHSRPSSLLYFMPPSDPMTYRIIPWAGGEEPWWGQSLENLPPADELDP